MYIVLFEPTKSRPTPGHIGFQQLWQIADDIKNNLDEAKLLQAAEGRHLDWWDNRKQTQSAYCLGVLLMVVTGTRGKPLKQWGKKVLCFLFKVGAVVCLFLSEEDLEKT